MWTIFRLRGSVHSRPAFALFFIVSGQINNILIQGITVINVPTPLGQMNAFITWLELSLGGLEALLYVRTLGFKSNRKSQATLQWLLLFNIANIYALVSNHGTLIFSDFFMFLSTFVILKTRPTRTDLTLTLHYLTFVIVVNFFCVFQKIRSPDYPFNTLPSYHLPPYRNFTWSIFGIDERYRGPFQHPNATGAYLALIAIFFLCSRRRYFYFWIFPTFTLLLLSSSRTSEIVVILFIVVTMTLNFTNPGGKYEKFRGLVFGAIVIFLIFLIPKLDWTGTGRTSIFQRGIRNWLNSPIFGQGRPEISLLVENSFISTLLISGSIGGIFFILIFVNIFGAIRDATKQIKYELTALVAGFLFGINLEATFLGTYDVGALYIILITTILTEKSAIIYRLVPEHVFPVDKPLDASSDR